MGSQRSQDPAAGDLEAMWESILACEWSSLAVVPTDHDTPVELVLESFRAIENRLQDPSLTLLDGRESTVAQGEALPHEVAAATAAGNRVVVVVDSVMRSLAGIPLLRKVDLVLLVIRIGAGDPEGLASTVGIIGSDRLLGSVAVPVED